MSISTAESQQPGELTTLAPDPRVWISGPAVRRRFNGISGMTLWRWMHRPDMDFPQPMVLNRRNYFRLSEIEAFEARQRDTRAAA